MFPMPSWILMEDEVVHVPANPIVQLELLLTLEVAIPVSSLQRCLGPLHIYFTVSHSLKKKKANSQLKQTEKEYGQKLAKSSQIIAELKTTISSLSEENSRQQLAAEQRLQEVIQKFEDAKQQLIADNDRAIKAFQDEIESYRNQVQAAEKKLQHRELETHDQMTSIQQEYENTLKGLMPASLRQELEDTIISLKTQVDILQKTVSVLQEELDTYHAG
ncbi:PREDICTED: centrosomal protein of 112 kDa-like, partial [Cariama cristata]|uniref:centrosomal protein of 112 kDa-like n=1 Tax=Cariama cristata TaxID=54380 RepID=UPI00052008BF